MNEKLIHEGLVVLNARRAANRLTVPYADERELFMDILRHGSQVVVEALASLRKLVAREAARVTTSYA